MSLVFHNKYSYILQNVGIFVIGLKYENFKTVGAIF